VAISNITINVKDVGKEAKTHDPTAKLEGIPKTLMAKWNNRINASIK
jgi:hypothetical protein